MRGSMVSAGGHGQCGGDGQCGGHGQCRASWSLWGAMVTVGPWSVRGAVISAGVMVSARGHGQCRGPWSVWGGPWSVWGAVVSVGAVVSAGVRCLVRGAMIRSGVRVAAVAVCLCAGQRERAGQVLWLCVCPSASARRAGTPRALTRPWTQGVRQAQVCCHVCVCWERVTARRRRAVCVCPCPPRRARHPGTGGAAGCNRSGPCRHGTARPLMGSGYL